MKCQTLILSAFVFLFSSMGYAKAQISYQANIIANQLNVWAQARGGTAVVVSNLRDLWQQAAQSSQKPIIYVCYMGENPRGSFQLASITHRVDRQWTVCIKRGRGFTAVRGDTLSTTTSVDPFYDNAEEARDLIRVLLGISEEFPLDYKGMKPMQLGGQVIDAYLIEFSTANDLPEVVLTLSDSPQS
jgi:hypothetical protein